MESMFFGCTLLKEIVNFNFNPENENLNIKSMFFRCSDELIPKIKGKYIFKNNDAFGSFKNEKYFINNMKYKFNKHLKK